MQADGQVISICKDHTHTRTSWVCLCAGIDRQICFRHLRLELVTSRHSAVSQPPACIFRSDGDIE